ncbi:hypothetical protein FJ872_31590 [Mesorhizobium sp. B2-5-9]|uniref:hypothetical protein n=1 Tax=Mesorhizobium sp. B2-5-9 TaxID=2589921 RepID=UPI00112AB95B|nr:hypothetical protein [Mesorhizobium sp. B2-5-9]TPJ98529.1 hypothetical protein FJ872_31590 [Mesorhizobium sp. B2-5-9]
MRKNHHAHLCEVPDLLRGISIALAAASLIYTSSSYADDGSDADRYLKSLSQGVKIYVWPSFSKYYEYIGDSTSVRSYVKEYREQNRDINRLDDVIRTAQISIVSIKFRSFKESVARVMARLLPKYKEFAITAQISSDGCTAYRFTSRDTWMAVGIIFIDEDEVNSAGEKFGIECIAASLDYVGGFPVATSYFDYKELPGKLARKQILKAIRACSKRRSIDPDNNSTKDGIFPLPSMSCVESGISK